MVVIHYSGSSTSLFCILICSHCSPTHHSSTSFSRCRSPEALPPTSDAARLHNRRARFQAMIWKQAHVTNPTLPLPESMGWSRLNDRRLHCSSQQQQHYILQMYFSTDVIVKPSRSPLPRFLGSMWSSLNFFPDVFLLMASKVGDLIAPCYCMKGENSFYFRNCFLQKFTTRVD